MSRDDYTRLAESLDEDFNECTVFIDTDQENDWKTVVVDTFGSDSTPEDIVDAITDSNKLRDVYGFGVHQVDLNHRVADERVLITLE